jgi:tetratricopeptide (TPR) repeat protein
LSKARQLSRQATTSPGQAAFPEATGGLIANEALREAELGNAARARALTEKALSLTQGRNTEVLAALTLARVGDSPAAEKMADRLNQEAPLDTMIQGYWLPAIRATIALNRKNPEQALSTLRDAFKYELGSPIEFINHNGPMYPAYVRGQAYLAGGHAPQAIDEFQKMINHPGIMLNSILAPLAHLQLARAQVMMGDKAAARKSYQDFLTLWKDADPDIPIYKQAKAEYTKLR